MPSNRQLISDIVNGAKLLSIDDRKSNRFILSQLRDKAVTLIKQDTDSRRLFAVGEFWSRINCVNLEEIDAIECCSDIPNCKTIMRSKVKIPKVYLSSYGSIIKVMTVNSESEYKQTTRSKYKDIVNREHVNSFSKYFWIEGDYLYIPNSSVRQVMVLGLFLDPSEVDKLNCGDSSTGCASPLDSPFPAPDYILSIAKSQVLQEYAGITARLIEDESADSNTNKKI